MCSTLKTTLLAGLTGLIALTSVQTASADSYFGLGGGSGPRIEFRVEDGRSDHRRDRDRDWRDDRRGDRDRGRDRDRDRRDVREGCSPERALWRAERMGLRRARVVDVSRRTVVVRGRDRGDRVTVVFARAPGCPVIENY